MHLIQKMALCLYCNQQTTNAGEHKRTTTMNSLTITQTFTTSNDLIKSGLLEKWFDNFGMKHIMMDKINRMDKYNPTYYIVKAEAKHNYGLDFNIYTKYTADGINFLKQMCTTSSLTSDALRRAIITDNIISFGNEGYAKDNNARPALRNVSKMNGWIFC